MGRWSRSLLLHVLMLRMIPVVVGSSWTSEVRLYSYTSYLAYRSIRLNIPYRAAASCTNTVKQLPNGVRLSSTLPMLCPPFLTFPTLATSTSRYKTRPRPTNNIPHSTCFFIPSPIPQKDLTNTDPPPSLQSCPRRDSTSSQR